MNRRNFLGAALAAIPLFGLKWPQFKSGATRLKSDVPRLKVGDFGAARCTIHDAYTGINTIDDCYTWVDCEEGIVERIINKPSPIDGRRPRVMERRWVIVRLHPDDK